MPKNTETGILLAACATALGFGMIWYMWWLAALSFVALLGTRRSGTTFNYHRDFHIPADEVIETEAKRTQLLSAQA